MEATAPPPEGMSLVIRSTARVVPSRDSASRKLDRGGQLPGPERSLAVAHAKAVKLVPSIRPGSISEWESQGVSIDDVPQPLKCCMRDGKSSRFSQCVASPDEPAAFGFDSGGGGAGGGAPLPLVWGMPLDCVMLLRDEVGGGVATPKSVVLDSAVLCKPHATRVSDAFRRLSSYQGQICFQVKAGIPGGSKGVRPADVSVVSQP